jgi:CSLREA domain-containing protein
MLARRTFLGALTLSLLALLLAAAPSAARTYTIATFVDDTLPNANCTLREAIRAARDDVPADECPAGDGADTIVLPDGLYYFAGAESVFGDISLEIRGESQDPAAVGIDLGGTGRFLEAFGTGSGAGQLAMSGITVQNGAAAGEGGAIFLYRYGLVLERMLFTANHADGGGGALLFHAGSTPVQLRVSATRFVGNTAFGLGGAVKVSVIAGGVALLEDTVFLGNTASAGGGHAEAAGGGLELQAHAGGSARLLRCRFESNSVSTSVAIGTADALGGGASLTAAGGELVVRDVRFLGNRAAVDSASIGHVPALDVVAYGGGVIDLDRVLVHGSLSSFRENAADVRLRADSLAAVALTNGRVTTGTGNGIAAIADEATITLGYLTVADYTFGTGAELYTEDGGTVRLHGSLLADNGADLITFGAGVQTANNCAAMAGDFPGFVDALGGDFRLTPTSVAVDAGDPAATRPFDLDHAPRRVQARVDCGAYELGGLFADDFESGDTSAFSASHGG